jgi:hypothetical protein
VPAHFPFAHTWLELHALLHVPQFALSLFKFVQYALASPHFVSPFAHAELHCPLKHASPDAHVLPHAPQLVLSDCVSTQSVLPPSPPHSVSFCGHVPAQSPFTHASPAEHCTPHAPQLSESLCRFAQKVEHDDSPFVHVSVVFTAAVAHATIATPDANATKKNERAERFMKTPHRV